MNEDDLRFMWDDAEYAFDDFAVGEGVQYQDDNGEWHSGTVNQIDYDDPSLPWGVTTEAVVVDQDGNFDEDAHPTVSWNWQRPNAVRKQDYTIDEEEDVPMAVSW